MAPIARQGDRGVHRVRPAEVSQRAQHRDDHPLQRHVGLGLADDRLQGGGHLGRGTFVTRLRQQARGERPQRRIFIVLLERVKKLVRARGSWHRPRPMSAARRTSSTSRSVARIVEIGPARHAQPPQRLHLGASHEGPRLLLGAGDERAARGDVPQLLQAEGGRLPHARILIIQRSPQRGPRVGGRAGVLHIPELTRGQVAQDRIIGDRLRRRQRLRAPLGGQGAQRDDRAGAQLEGAVGAEDPAQGRDGVGAALGRPLDRLRQDARQVGGPRGSLFIVLVVSFGRRPNAASTASARTRWAPLVACTIALRKPGGPLPIAASNAAAAASSSKAARMRAARARSSTEAEGALSTPPAPRPAAQRRVPEQT